MVASPNVNFGGADGLANFLQDQQRQADEQGRQTKYPFSAGPAGTSFQIYPDPVITDASGVPVVDTVLRYGDGKTALSIKPGAALYGNKQQMVMRDLSGAVTYATDESAGYGLSAPIYSYFMAPVPGVAYTAGTEAEIARAEVFVYNPTWASKILIRNFTGITSLSVRFVVTNGATTVASTATTVTGPSYILKMVLLPASLINSQSVVGQWLVTPNVNGTVDGWPILSAGASKSAYDAAGPNFH